MKRHFPNIGKWRFFDRICRLLLHQLNREELVRSNGGERQGRKPQAYWRMARFSDAEFLRQDEQKNSGFNWGSNINISL